MIKGIDHIAVNVVDMERSVDFYTDVLRFEEVIRWRAEIPGISEIVFLRLGDCMLELLEPEEPEEFDGGVENQAGIKHLCFEVEDFEGEVERLKKRGVPVEEEPHVLTDEHLTTIATAMDFDLEKGLKRAVFLDPDGVPIELLQWQ